MSTNSLNKRAIVGFVQDAEGHWVALLACGHRQHVRHNPPLSHRPWVLTAAGRHAFLGHELVCKLCAEADGSAADDC